MSSAGQVEPQASPRSRGLHWRRAQRGYSFNQPLQGVAWPAELRRLALGRSFDQPLSGVAWPPRLHTLTLGALFNQSLDGDSLPRSAMAVAAGRAGGGSERGCRRRVRRACLPTVGCARRVAQRLGRAAYSGWAVGGRRADGARRAARRVAGCHVGRGKAYLPRGLGRAADRTGSPCVGLTALGARALDGRMAERTAMGGACGVPSSDSLQATRETPPDLHAILKDVAPEG